MLYLAAVQRHEGSTDCMVPLSDKMPDFHYHLCPSGQARWLGFLKAFPKAKLMGPILIFRAILLINIAYNIAASLKTSALFVPKQEPRSREHPTLIVGCENVV